MKQRSKIIIAAFLAVITALLMLCGCSGSTGDKIERFAEAAPAGNGSISIPGYEELTFKAGSQQQSADLRNPATNDCYFRLSLTVGSETLWTSDYIGPGEAVRTLTLSRAPGAGNYDAVLHYDCFTLNDKSSLNGAEIKLTIIVK